MHLIGVDTVGGHGAEEHIVVVSLDDHVVGLGVPEAPVDHLHALAFLLPDRHLHNVFVAFWVASLETLSDDGGEVLRDVLSDVVFPLLDGVKFVLEVLLDELLGVRVVPELLARLRLDLEQLYLLFS